jgi:hypothetical protein
MKYT